MPATISSRSAEGGILHDSGISIALDGRRLHANKGVVINEEVVESSSIVLPIFAFYHRCRFNDFIPCSRSDWPQYRGPNRTGVTSEQKLQSDWTPKGPKLLWTYKATGSGYSGPAVVGNVLYICGSREHDEYLMALDLEVTPPKEIWSVKIGPLFTWKGNSWNEGPNVSPTIQGDSAYALGGFGDLICVNLKTGQERWRVNLPKDFGGEVNPIGGGLEEPTPLGWGYAAAPLVE